MEISSSYAAKFSQPKGKAYTREQELADQINSYFKGFPRPLTFGQILSFIRRRGYQFCYETFNDIRQLNCDNPPALFLWRMRNTKVELKDVP